MWLVENLINGVNDMSILNTKRTHCRFALSGALLSSLLLVNSCAVTQCGVLQLQKATKPGVAVSNNRCTSSDMALESIVYLQANTSVRLVSSSRWPFASGHQILCQNQSSFPLKIKVTSAASPWIRPEQDLIHCNDWLNSRLECNASWSDKMALICAISEQENVIVLRGNLTITSPKMRSPQPDNVDMEMERLKVDEVLKNYIKPKIEQCRKNYPSDQVLTLAWTIKSNGVVTDTPIPENISEDKFVDCAVEVIEDWIFPPFQNDMPVAYEF
jgi:hypothetical protein